MPAARSELRDSNDPRSRSVWPILAILAAFTFAAYSPAWHGGVLWDDDGHLTSSALRAPGGLGRIWFDVGATQQYYPLVHSAFWVMDRLWGADMLGYHLVNIGLHVACAWLLALVLRRLSMPGAILAAVIFALHPVHVESVAWITELKNTLSGALYLAAALAYLRFDSDRAGRPYAVSLVLFILALLSKTVTASLPAGLLVVFWWKRGRIDWRRDVLPLTPFLALGLAGGVTTAWVERTFIGAVGPEFALSVVQRCLIAGRALWFYVGKLVWPEPLVFIYPRWSVSGGVWWQYLFPLAAVAFTAALWTLRHRTRAPLGAWLFFAVSLSPALGFVNVFPFRYSFVADHFQYLASIGVIALAAAGIVAQFAKRGLSAARVETVACALFVLPLGMLTWKQSHQYVDAPTLYQTTLSKNPACWMAHSNLGMLALTASPPDLERALAHVQESLRLFPGNEVARNNLGVIFQKLGRLDDAVREHREAIRLQPNYADAYSNLATDLGALGRPHEALAAAVEAVRLKPHSSGAQHNLGLSLQEVGRIDDAIPHIREAVRLEPGYSDAHDNLGTALMRAGRIEEAAAAYQEAVRLNPTSGQFLNNLGSVLLRLNRIDAAAAALESAVRLLPDGGLARDNLGRVRTRQGRRDEALALFAEAVRLAPEYAPAHEHLAEVLHDAGRLPEALVEYREALRLTPQSATAHNNVGVILATLGRVAEAATHFSEAVRLAPDFTEARANLAKARGRQEL